MWLGETVVTLKRDVDGSLYSFNTLVFVKTFVSQGKIQISKPENCLAMKLSSVKFFGCVNSLNAFCK